MVVLVKDCTSSGHAKLLAFFQSARRTSFSPRCDDALILLLTHIECLPGKTTSEKCLQ